jgi:hypothetical protein
MALYKDPTQMMHSDDAIFDQLHKPGVQTPYSGIYMCVNCLDEVASNAGNPLPPQNHRQHKKALPPIQWRLLVRTQRGPD